MNAAAWLHPANPRAGWTMEIEGNDGLIWLMADYPSADAERLGAKIPACSEAREEACVRVQEAFAGLLLR